ncbi:Complex I intermediate-associated protein 84, mitochondrial [Frankliniella fusca]|uniref:Complex I intermediate-associated protein 84, mitochondrial n=1 Tax=Frankliniella fusca TaxID=407009 RepID=A0AAE1HJE3_9NEOP|nr:Complex I intermediate-associated protein 84, mitochondrial [Frankliniella fusca]
MRASQGNCPSAATTPPTMRSETAPLLRPHRVTSIRRHPGASLSTGGALKAHEPAVDTICWETQPLQISALLALGAVETRGRAGLGPSPGPGRAVLVLAVGREGQGRAVAELDACAVLAGLAVRCAAQQLALLSRSPYLLTSRASNTSTSAASSSSSSGLAMSQRSTLHMRRRAEAEPDWRSNSVGMVCTRCSMWRMSWPCSRRRSRSSCRRAAARSARSSSVEYWMERHAGVRRVSRSLSRSSARRCCSSRRRWCSASSRCLLNAKHDAKHAVRDKTHRADCMRSSAAKLLRLVAEPQASIPVPVLERGRGRQRRVSEPEEAEPWKHWKQNGLLNKFRGIGRALKCFGDGERQWLLKSGVDLEYNLSLLMKLKGTGFVTDFDPLLFLLKEDKS